MEELRATKSFTEIKSEKVCGNLETTKKKLPEIITQKTSKTTLVFM